MSISALKDELLSLPASERLKLIDVLWCSLEEPDIKLREEAWAAESERRIDAYESGALAARDAAAVFAELRHKLAK